MKNLAGFVSFIRDHRLEAVARESMRVARGMDIPLLRFFEHIPDDVLLVQSMKSISDFATSLEDGTYISRQMENLQKWEDDKLDGISKDSIQPTDLVMIYAAQKKAYYRFLPQY
ncbi:MAG TPA: hypothetical protein VFU15_09715, partial [Bacteroidia bacterium]|nr:hypothetical protein [Bacteroidia bacterium]